MAAENVLLNAAADAIGALITHIALFDGASEVTGGSPAYARQAVTWTSASNGLIRPTADLTFDIPAGANVTEWRGYTASSGGTNYGSGDLTDTPFAAQGEYSLVAATTGIDFDAA